MKTFLTTLFLLFSINIVSAQNNGIGIGTTSPHESAILELSDSTRGFLPTRMTTTQRNLIVQPAEGLQIYNTTTDCLQIFGNGNWYSIYCIPDDNSVARDIDGNYYSSVILGPLTWTGRNLRVARYRNGDIIPQVSDPSDWSNLTSGAWCWYQNDSAAYGAAYGRLYNWYAVTDPRGLAPQGWHIPSDAEWFQLSDHLGGIPNAGGKIKFTGFRFWASPNAEADNSSGFSALPGGYRNREGAFHAVRHFGYWWTTTQTSTERAWIRHPNFYNGALHRDNANKGGAYSVRCVKD